VVKIVEQNLDAMRKAVISAGQIGRSAANTADNRLASRARFVVWSMTSPNELGLVILRSSNVIAGAAGTISIDRPGQDTAQSPLGHQFQIRLVARRAAAFNSPAQVAAPNQEDKRDRHPV
jgi:hypothetical protein